MDSTLVSIAQIALAAIAIGVGTMKVTRPYDALAKQFFWIGDLSPEMVKSIGASEVVLGIALLVPKVMGLSYWLAVGAAVAYAALMVVVAAFHGTERGWMAAVPRVTLIALSLVVIVGLT